MNQIRPASLLIVLVHPDDEIFHGGVLAHLSERGVRVTLVCATDLASFAGRVVKPEQQWLFDAESRARQPKFLNAHRTEVIDLTQ